jgi:hypothetical protein
LAGGIFNGGGDSGEIILSEFVFSGGWNASDQLCFYILNFNNNVKNLRPLQALVPRGLINKYFHLFHDFYGPGKGGDKTFHFWHCVWRRG